jgi:hypothetical protein
VIFSSGQATLSRTERGTQSVAPGGSQFHLARFGDDGDQALAVVEDRERAGRGLGHRAAARRLEGDRDAAGPRRGTHAAALDAEPGAIDEELPHRQLGAFAHLDGAVAADPQGGRAAGRSADGIVEAERERNPGGHPLAARAAQHLHLALQGGQLDRRGLLRGWRR